MLRLSDSSESGQTGFSVRTKAIANDHDNLTVDDMDVARID